MPATVEPNSLKAFIQGNHRDIIGEFSAFARTLMPPNSSLTDQELRDHCEELLLAVAADLAPQKRAVPRGHRGAARRDVRRTAAERGHTLAPATRPLHRRVHGALRGGTDPSVCMAIAGVATRVPADTTLDGSVGAVTAGRAGAGAGTAPTRPPKVRRSADVSVSPRVSAQSSAVRPSASVVFTSAPWSTRKRITS